MMPCKRCSPEDKRPASLFDASGKPLRGLEQLTKTQRAGTKGGRIYRCQDCGALWRLTFDTATKTASEEPVDTEH